MTNTARVNYASYPRSMRAAGALRQQEPAAPTEADLCAEIIALSQKFFTQAEALDAAFVRNTDKRARERGAFCAEAVTNRYIASQLRELARKID